MSEYLVSGRNPKGRKVTERVDAESGDEAVQALRDRGFEEIVLHTSDVEALYTYQSKVAATISPRQYLWFRELPKPLASFLIITINVYRKTWIFSVGCLVWLSYRRYGGFPWSSADTLIAVFLLFPAIWALCFELVRGFRLVGRFNRMTEAEAWGRWEEVLRRVDAIGGKIPPEIVAFHKARALAALGRLDDSLRIVEPFSDGVMIPEWHYWSQLAGVYEYAKRYEDARLVTEKALNLAPENATVLIALSRREVRHRHNLRRARELLTRAREHAISNLLQPYVTLTEGQIRLEEGHAREALPLLEQAYREFTAFRHASPSIGSRLDQMHASLALAHAATGDTDAALRHYRLAQPRLQALKLDDQIARCEKAIGLPPGG